MGGVSLSVVSRVNVRGFIRLLYVLFCGNAVLLISVTRALFRVSIRVVVLLVGLVLIIIMLMSSLVMGLLGNGI